LPAIIHGRHAVKIKPRSNWKLVVAFGAALLTLLVVGGISYRYMVGSEEDVQWVQHTRETLGTLDGLLSAEASIDSSIRGFALSGNDSYLASYQASVLRADQAEAAIRKLTADNPVQQARLPALEALATAKVKRAEVVIGLRRAEGLQGVANAFAGGEGQRLSDGVQAIVHDLQNEELRLLELRRAASSRSEEGSQRAAIFGSVLGLLIVSAAAWSARRDAGVRKAAARQVAQVEGRYRGLLEAAPDAMVVVNQGGEIVLSNLQAEKQFGYGSGELLGRQVTSIIPQGFAERLVADGTRSAAEALVQQTGKGIELSAKRKDGSEFPIEIMLSPLASDEGVLVTAAIRDITVHNRNEAKLLELARLDLLTGLPNRAVFAAAIQKAIAWARNGGPGFAVFYLDLDHFKDVNDTLGHPVGDALLKEVAQRLEANVRETDTVARFGGDEFAILATEIKEPAVAGVLAAGLLEIFSEPFSVGGNQIRSGASIGIAVYGVDATGAEMLLSRADVALYRAKEEGRGTYRFFTEAMDADVRTRVALGHDLRDAIGSPQIFLVYQPQVEASTGRIVGVEALARWRHPTRGMISPAEFIPAAETNGLIVALGHWVLWEACRQAGKWREAGIAPGVMAVNLSALQFKTPLELEKDVVAALAASSLPPGMLELEITESLLMAASFANNEVLVRLRASGIRLAIDDFGTGFSSLDYLRQFPMDRIKIAQNFVLELGTAASTAAGSAAVVKATIGLARELGIGVIAEGVETAEQLRLIKSWRCHEVQGYFFAKPLSPEELLPLLQAGRIVPPGPVELKPAA
jgi:diguanylate cyclase (GGDEF)-like protein/PAS domain S-box-containing protein